MSNAPSGDNTPNYGAALRRRYPFLRWFGVADDAIYALERIVVTVAMLLMSGVVCISVLYQFVARQEATWNNLGNTTSVGDLWPVLGVALCVVLLARGVWSQSPIAKGNRPVTWGLTGITTVLFGVFCAVLLLIPSHIVMAGLLLACGVWVYVAELDRPIALASPTVSTATKVRLGIVVIATLALAYGAYATHVEKYSWTNKLALFLLLWTAFIGASMATHDQRHLTVDAIRKIVPNRALPFYQALSHLVAAAFTAAFCYLAFLYLGDRLQESPPPGEIPDWLKVLAIPVSLLLVTLRFSGQAIAAAMYGFIRPDEDAAEGRS